MKGMRTSAIMAAALGLAALQGASAEDRSAEVFNGFCNRCHGTEGQGNKGLEAPTIAGMPAWYVEAQLKKFRDGIRGKHPKDDPGMRMRPIARSINESDAKAVSAYVAALPPRASVTTLTDANIQEGKAASAVCAGCHGKDAKGMEKPFAAPNLAGQDDWYMLTQLKNFKSGVRVGPMMQPIVANMDEVKMRNLAAYFGSLSAK